MIALFLHKNKPHTYKLKKSTFAWGFSSNGFISIILYSSDDNIIYWPLWTLPTQQRQGTKPQRKSSTQYFAVYLTKL